MPKKVIATRLDLLTYNDELQKQDVTYKLKSESSMAFFLARLGLRRY